MHKIMTGYMGIIILTLACIAFPPFLVAAVPLVIWRVRAFRRGYLTCIDEAETELRARAVHRVTQSHMAHAKAWR